MGLKKFHDFHLIWYDDSILLGFIYLEGITVGGIDSHNDAHISKWEDFPCPI